MMNLDEEEDRDTTSDKQQCTNEIGTKNLPLDSQQASSSNTTKWEEEVLEDGCGISSGRRRRKQRKRRRRRRSYDVNKLQRDYLYNHNIRKRSPLFQMFEWVERHMVLASLRST